MTWNASLKLDYSLEAGKSVARFEHQGPLRILQSLYPEGDAICHNVIVHPPGGLVGGDNLSLNFSAAAGSHGLVTTPGASRFYRSEGKPALQSTKLQLADNSRLEWLPLEAICYSGCLAENRLSASLAPSAELLAWDITALGLPAAGKPFVAGSFCQHLELPGVWLERAQISANDELLMNSPLGLAGQRCIATLFFAAGSKLGKQRRQQALEIAHEVIKNHSLCAMSGVSSPDPQIVVLRVLSPMVEPAMDLLRQIRLVWRSHFWGLAPSNPRIWST